MGDRVRVGSRMAVAGLCLTLALPACAGASDGSTASSDVGQAGSPGRSSPAADGVEAAAVEYFTAIVELRFADAYALYSTECRSTAGEADFVRRMTRTLDGSSSIAGDREIAVGDAQVTELTTNSAKAAVSISWADNVQTSGWEPYVYQDGAWWFADCDFGVDRGD
jgi:hypothetical protein